MVFELSLTSLFLVHVEKLKEKFKDKRSQQQASAERSDSYFFTKLIVGDLKQLLKSLSLIEV